MARALFKFLILCWVSVCIVPTSADAYPVQRNGDEPLSGTHTALAVLVGVGSVLGLIYALFNCSCCDESSLLKYEETPEEEDVATVQNDDDFTPPTESTPDSKGKPTLEETPPVINLRAAPSVDTSAVEAFNDPKLQFSRDQLNYLDEIGSGWFGKALKGEANQIHPGMRKTRVIVKQLKDSATPDEQVLFVKEVQPYREVNHPNVLMLLGQCLETSPLLLIMEYAPNGDLKAFLQKNQDKVQSYAQDDVQLRMATNIISGLQWLHQKDFVHIDLAARNCQVCADDIIKIGDYGTSLEHYPNDYYMTKDKRHAVPIRWLAPEVIDANSENIEPKKITKQSNIWSYGVIMMELSTGGETPYPELSDEEVLQKVVREKQMETDKPNLAMKYADRWFETMAFCWLDEPDRPNTKEVYDLIQHLNTYKDQLNQADFDARWNALKPAAARESEPGIDIPQQPVVEEEITVTPESQQLSESPPQMDDDDDFEPRAGEVTNPFMKDDLSVPGGPAVTSTPMPPGKHDDSSSYVTATSSFLDTQDEDNDMGSKDEDESGGFVDQTAGPEETGQDDDDFNTLVETMMDETIESLKQEDSSLLVDDGEKAEDDGEQLEDDEEDDDKEGEDGQPEDGQSNGGDGTQQDSIEPAETTGLISEDEKKDENQNGQREMFHSEAGIAIAERPAAPTTQPTEESPKEPQFHGYAQVEKKESTGPKKLTITVSSGHKSKTLEIDNNKPTKEEVPATVAPEPSPGEAGDAAPSLTFKITGKKEEEEKKEPEQDNDVEENGRRIEDLTVIGSNGVPGGEPEKTANGHAAGDTNGHIQDGLERDDDNKDCKRGKLYFSVVYDKQKMELQCMIHSASNLKAMDPNGFSDPYVKLHILPRASSRSTKLRTKTKYKTLDPKFKEELTYHGIISDDLHTKTLRLSVWDEDSLGHNDFIGEYHLPLKKLPMNETKSYNIFLQDKSEEDEEIAESERGKILLGLQYYKKQNQMSINIVRCAGLYAMDSNGFSDPYVKLYLQPDPHKKTKKKTATKKKTLNPEYKETFIYKLPPEDVHTKTLEVTVWDKDVGSNDYIGGIQLGSTTRGDRRQHWTDAIENPDQMIERWHILSETQFADDD